MLEELGGGGWLTKSSITLADCLKLEFLYKISILVPSEFFEFDLARSIILYRNGTLTLFVHRRAFSQFFLSGIEPMPKFV